jgi:hypothetical protein
MAKKACKNGTKLEFHPYPGLGHTPALYCGLWDAILPIEGT